MSMSVSSTSMAPVQATPPPRAVQRDDGRAAQAKRDDETREAQRQDEAQAAAKRDASGDSARTTGRAVDVSV